MKPPGAIAEPLVHLGRYEPRCGERGTHVRTEFVAQATCPACLGGVRGSILIGRPHRGPAKGELATPIAVDEFCALVSHEDDSISWGGLEISWFEGQTKCADRTPVVIYISVSANGRHHILARAAEEWASRFEVLDIGELPR